MRFKTRYRFWHVVLVFIGLCILAAIFYYSAYEPSTHKETVNVAPKQKARPGPGFRALLTFFYFITFFYFALNYYYNLIAANKKFVSFLKVTGMIILIAFVYNAFLFYFIPNALHDNYDSLGRMFGGLLVSMIPMLLFSYLFAYVTVLRESLKQKRALEAQKLQLEMQISQANFNFLKAQINPHFLHNTLNYLYAKSLPYSAELSEGILTLSDMMRYALAKGNQKDGKAPLIDEIEHVNNVIKISQLRYSNQLKVNFEVSGDVNGVTIIPFVLITLVENAFMHGDLKSQDYPINIKLNVKGDRLYFYCGNKKRSGPKQLSTGIGLDNIIKRLDLAYGDKYKYIVKDDAEFYTTELTIEQL
jgi:two-component system, LytTR family, sensor kinase